MKPELLLPVSNVETFFAACEGGADAVYLGLKKFNARGKAPNFNLFQLQALLKEAKKNNVKVYLTLNTLIKNSELPELINVLYQLSQSEISAVIIQDWGVYYLINKFFQNIPVHASTQMGNHNSIGTQYSHKKKIQRVILARELTWKELTTIKKRSQVELELFVHGALCYSFSGMCLFSSFNGGMSANRGLCTQPCRRLYSSENNSSQYLFSLKDLQLMKKIPQLLDLNLTSLKIEGRMKSAEYVYQTARAYRLALDEPHRIEEAKEILNSDFGRKKTAYFMGRNVSKAITQDPYIGILIGRIKNVFADGFSFKTEHDLNLMNRLRILSADGTNSAAIKIKEMYVNGQQQEKVSACSEVKIITDKIQQAQLNDKVFLLSFLQKKFPARFKREGKQVKLQLADNKMRNIMNRIGSPKIPKFQQIFVRINQLKWLNKMYFEDLDKLILNLTKTEWENFNLKNNFIKQNIFKFIIQLPKFIPEDYISYYRDLAQYFYRNSIKQFMISHVSQKHILPNQRDIQIYSSENVYALNDASIQFLKEEGFTSWIYPFENDYQNLINGKDRSGVIPVFFLPELFYSRMPIQIDDNVSFKDIYGSYIKLVRDGQTIVIPEKPVALLQHYNKFIKNGFRRFLLDLSYQHPSQKTFRRLVKNLLNSSKEHDSVIFNFKAGLK
ncbi:MAG: hypothetical protein APR54_10450 [Candidatus Cloacimonas sp. SDB]|nr:MAG: hypothetical protein APR54_10450 [Candidatus Cloacimonas sp. SDB]